MLQIFVFAVAFAASAAPPGPDTLTVFSRGLHGGFGKAIPFALGVCLAKLTLLSLALLGIAEIAERFETGFLAIKYLGAGYLCFLGVRKIVDATNRSEHEETVTDRSPWQDTLVGYGLGVSNPNAVIFYVALLPSVVPVGEISAITYLSLSAIVVVLWLAVAATYAGLADRLRTAMKSTIARKRMQRTSGAAMLGAGVLVATR